MTRSRRKRRGVTDDARPNRNREHIVKAAREAAPWIARQLAAAALAEIGKGVGAWICRAGAAAAVGWGLQWLSQ